MKKMLLIINGPAYGADETFNAARLAVALSRRDAEVKVFLMGDAVTCAVSGQKTPDGCYSLDRMLTGLIRHTFAYDTSTVNGAPGHPGRGLVKPGQPERSLAKMTDHLSRRVVRRSAPARCPRSRRR